MLNQFWTIQMLNLPLKYDIGDILKVECNGRHYEGTVYNIKVSVKANKEVSISYHCIKSNGKAFRHVVLYKRLDK